MRYILPIFLISLLYADFRSQQIAQIDKIIAIYQKRLECLKTKEAANCINSFPLDSRSDALAKTFSMSFPKAFYESKLKRDIKFLQKQKLCIGKALSKMEAKRCLSF